MDLPCRVLRFCIRDHCLSYEKGSEAFGTTYFCRFDEREGNEPKDYSILRTNCFLADNYISRTRSSLRLVDSSALYQRSREEIRWFTKEELDDPKFGILEKIVIYAKAALEELAS